MAYDSTARKPPVRLVVSDTLGQIKVIQAPGLAQLDAATVVQTWGGPGDTTKSICSMSTSSSLPPRGGTDATSFIAIGRRCGTLQLLDAAQGLDALWSIQSAAHAESARQSTTDNAAVQGVHFYRPHPTAGTATQIHEKPTVLSVTEGGAARMHRDGEEKASWRTPPSVCCSALDNASEKFAVGCQGAELRVYSVSKPDEPVFSAKGGRPNNVGLTDRPWNTALDFIPGSDGQKIMVGTGHHKLRLYDSVAGKRPQLEVPFKDARITALAVEREGTRCWVANGAGEVEVFDIRAGKCAGALKGFTGSVRQLALASGREGAGTLVASVGLDRYLRVHDATSRRCVGKVYLKTQLTGVAWCLQDEPQGPLFEANEGDGEELCEEQVEGDVAARKRSKGRRKPEIAKKVKR